MRATNAVSLQFIMNRAINETLGRTILTGGHHSAFPPSLFTCWAVRCLHDFCIHDSRWHPRGHLLVDLRSLSNRALVVVLERERKKHRESQPKTVLAVRRCTLLNFFWIKRVHP